ncbi:N-acetylmuramoyl-L-alanine amidase [Bizionia sp.]|uniref:peptidoglycan recognition protein family protein n=1 Tax=Bizionia sp. TaxID=1954480 RepID=UPI003A92E856
MKNRIIKALATLLIAAGSGAAIYNNTGTDITLADGTTLESQDLTKSLTKHYQLRDVSAAINITIHHTAGPENASLESIAKFHVEKRGWPEIAYHIAINQDGAIHFLNEIEERTYHDSGQNTNSIGIVLVGNFETTEPSAAMLYSVKLVTESLCKVLNITSIRGHRDTSPTLCPGVNAYNQLETIFY